MNKYKYLSFIEDIELEDESCIEDVICKFAAVRHSKIKLTFKLIDSTVIEKYEYDESKLQKYYDDIGDDNLYISIDDDDGFLHIPKNSIISFKHEREYFDEKLEKDILYLIHACSSKYKEEIDQFQKRLKED